MNNTFSVLCLRELSPFIKIEVYVDTSVREGSDYKEQCSIIKIFLDWIFILSPEDMTLKKKNQLKKPDDKHLSRAMSR